MNNLIDEKIIMKIKQYNKKSLILIYPGYQNDAKLYQYNRLIEEFAKFGIVIDKLKVDDVIFDIQNNVANIKVDKYDFCIQLVKDKYIDALLNKAKIRSFNTYNAIENCDDKMMTYTLLAGNNIVMPSTILGGINLGVENVNKKNITEEFKKYSENSLGYPLIIKKSNSKGGRDIYKIDNRKNLDDICNKLNGNNYILQEFISINQGKDIRVVVIGGKVVGSFMRVNENDFRSNISLGGKAIKYEISNEYKKVAEKVAKILKLDYCSVDFFFTEDKSPVICEVNADPALCDIDELTGKNIAKIYAEYIIKKIYK